MPERITEFEPKGSLRNLKQVIKQKALMITDLAHQKLKVNVKYQRKKKEDSYWKAKVRSPEGLRLISQNFNKTEKIL